MNILHTMENPAMYDRVSFWLAGVQALPVSAVVRDAPGRALKASLGVWDLSLTSGGLLVTGSLTKEARGGENVGEMTMAQTRTALVSLESSLGVPIETGQVWSLEVGRTLIMKEPPARYLSLWEPLPAPWAMTRYPTGNILFHTGRASFQGYDKTLETGGESLPELYQGRYLLRLEWKLKRRVAEILGHPLAVGALTNEETYVNMLGRWKVLALGIPQARTPRPILSGKLSQLKESLAAVALRPHLDALLREIANRRDLPASERSRWKRELCDLVREPEWTDPDALTEEYRTKVRDAVRNYR